MLESFNPVQRRYTEGEPMSEKIPTVTAIKLVGALGYTSGDTKMWQLVSALKKGLISPESLSRTRK